MVKAWGAPVVRIVDGVKYEFPQLKRSQVARLLAEWVTQDRAALVGILEQAKATSAEKVKALADFGLHSGTIGYLIEKLTEFRRTSEAIRMSRGAARDEDIDDLPIPPRELVNIAMEVCGFEPIYQDYVSDAGNAESGGGDDPRPLCPVREDLQTWTGNFATPDSSASTESCPTS